MTPARRSRLLLLAMATLTSAACETQKKPIRGFDKLPPGSILLDNLTGGETGSLRLLPMFDLPVEPRQIFRVRLNGQAAVIRTAEEEGFYDYATLSLQGWTAAWPGGIRGVPPGSYAVELLDGSGLSWGQSSPLTVFAVENVYAPDVELPGVVFANFDGKVATWNIDPLLQDADPATDEITVTSMIDEDVVVERCLVASGTPTSCTPVGTVAPGAELHTVETVAGLSKDDHQALLVRLASDSRQVYQRDLDEGSGNFFNPSGCQIERIIVHGKRPETPIPVAGTVTIAVSSCYGYASGPS